MASTPKLLAKSEIFNGRTYCFQTFLVNQMSAPERQARSLTLKVSLLWSEIVSADSWHKLEKYPQLYLKLDNENFIKEEFKYC